MTPEDQLRAATDAVERAAGIVETAVRNLAQAVSDGGKVSVAKLDEHQVVAYDLAHAAAAVEASRVMVRYGAQGALESMLACAYVADAIHDVASRFVGRDVLWGINPADLAPAHPFVTEHRSPQFLERLAEECAKHGTGPSHLSDDFELVAETFRRFAEDKIRPAAEHVHRTNGDVPEDIIAGLAEIGGFGLSVPEEYDGFASGGEHDYIGMVVATEELSRGSLGIGGSLVTRPEILTRALVAGGTEEQKQTWLPRIASGELMVGIMVTEPDFGSDVAGVKVTASPTDDGRGYHVNGVKTWATFAGRANVLMLLARTDPDRSKGHRGLSVLIVEKPQAEGHAFSFDDGQGGKMEGRAIDTIGYRGMHSYEVAFDSW
jgi:(2S)-methylsuccinyl-CoA dehydrogenase